MDIIVVLGIIACVVYLKVNAKQEKTRRQLEIRKRNNQSNHKSSGVTCPKCLSSQISANKRGITVTTGLIGTQQVYITCLECGHRWKAGS